MSNMCPNLNEGINYEQVNALREYQRQQNFQGALKPRNDLLLVLTIRVG